ncbi:MAG: TetR/AcrR family transcriptional regulator [Nakamurella sp.]
MVSRRAEFAAAAVRVIARNGLHAATVRAVAAEAGWSPGALQKSFTSMDELIRAAIELIIEQAGSRMAIAASTGTLTGDIQAMIEQTLPLDSQRRDESKVWASLTIRAVDVPWIAHLLIEQDRQVIDALAGLLRAAQGTGEITADSEPVALAGALVALADGLAVRLLYDPSARPAVLAALAVGTEHLLPKGPASPGGRSKPR